MKLDKKKINSYYVIVAQVSLDEAIATDNELVYYTGNNHRWETAWGSFDGSSTYNNKTLLAHALMDARKQLGGLKPDAKIFPIYVETIISDAGADMEPIIRQQAREVALAKLTVEDQEALGLVGKSL